MIKKIYSFTQALGKMLRILGSMLVLSLAMSLYGSAPKKASTPIYPKLITNVILPSGHPASWLTLPNGSGHVLIAGASVDIDTTTGRPNFAYVSEEVHRASGTLSKLPAGLFRWKRDFD